MIRNRLRAVDDFQANVKFYFVWWELWTEAVKLTSCVGFNRRGSENLSVIRAADCLQCFNPSHFHINKWNLLPMHHLWRCWSLHTCSQELKIWLIKPSWRFFWLIFVQLLNDLNDFRVCNLTSILQRSHIHYVLRFNMKKCENTS